MSRKPGKQEKQPAAHARIKDWPVGERPREKLLSQGVGALSDTELLAILIRVGSGKSTAVDLAKAILVNEKNLMGVAGKSPQELMRLKGIGEAKAVELCAAFEIGRRVAASMGTERAIMKEPADVARMMGPQLKYKQHEAFWVLLLDAKNGLMHKEELTVGTLNASLVHPREVYKTAIDRRAAAVIVVHNHPSGNPEPSAEDVSITKQLAEAGKIIGIPLHDHVIIAGDTYTSLAERGFL